MSVRKELGKVSLTLTFPINNLQIPETREYINSLITVLSRMNQDISERLNGLIEGRLDHIIMQSPNNKYWKITIDDTGTLTTEDLGIKLPDEYG